MSSQYLSALTPEEVATILKLSKASIYRKIKTGEIPAKKMGKEYRISATFIWYFQTGMDYDIYQKQQVDAEAMLKFGDILKSVRQSS